MGCGAPSRPFGAYAPTDGAEAKAGLAGSRADADQVAVIAKAGIGRAGAASRFHAKYRLDVQRGRLGHGGFGSVFSVQRQGEEFAVKVADLRLRPGSWADPALHAKRWKVAVKEVGMLRRVLGRAHVVQLLDSYLEGGLYYIVMEKCEVTLMHSLASTPGITEMHLRRCFDDMLRGIAAVHAAGVVHRDVKPDNFLVHSSGEVKLCDFGAAVLSKAADAGDVGEGGLHGLVGTPPFMPPEMVAGKNYDEKIDAWSFGVIAYTLFFGSLPYSPPKPTFEAMRSAILSGQPAPSFQPAAALRPPSAGPPSAEAVSLLRVLLERRPQKRIAADAALGHAWFAAAPRRGGGGGDAQQVCLGGAIAAAQACAGFRSPSGDDGGCSKNGARAAEVEARLAALQSQARGADCQEDAPRPRPEPVPPAQLSPTSTASTASCTDAQRCGGPACGNLRVPDRRYPSDGRHSASKCSTCSAPRAASSSRPMV